MPIAQPPTSTARPIRIASRINPLTVIPPLVHASPETGAYDRLKREHTQGAVPMKANPRRPRGLRLVSATLVGVLSAIALSSAAQTPFAWKQDEQRAAVVTASATPVAYPSDRPAPLPADIQRRPLASGCDVRVFEAMAQELVANQRVPGLAMAIVHQGQVLSARGYGITDVDNAEPVDAHTVFRLASLSKSFAGTLTAMLVAEGALRWDSRVADFIPSLQLADPDAARQLTVADVLSHRVGLRHHTFDRDIEANADYHSLVQRLSAAPMVCAPGECYGYQNVAFSLVGDVVFAASGQFYNEAVARRIFK